MPRRPDKALEIFFKNEYIDNIFTVKYVAIDIGMEKAEFVRLIKQINESELKIIKDKLYELYIHDDEKYTRSISNFKCY